MLQVPPPRLDKLLGRACNQDDNDSQELQETHANQRVPAQGPGFWACFSRLMQDCRFQQPSFSFEARAGFTIQSAFEHGFRPHHDRLPEVWDNNITIGQGQAQVGDFSLYCFACRQEKSGDSGRRLQSSL